MDPKRHGSFSNYSTSNNKNVNNSNGFDENELKQILELSKRTYLEETFKRTHASQSFGGLSTAASNNNNNNMNMNANTNIPRKHSTAAGGSSIAQPQTAGRSMTDDDLINLKSGDPGTETKLNNIRKILNESSYSSYKKSDNFFNNWTPGGLFRTPSSSSPYVSASSTPSPNVRPPCFPVGSSVPSYFNASFKNPTMASPFSEMVAMEAFSVAASSSFGSTAKSTPQPLPGSISFPIFPKMELSSSPQFTPFRITNISDYKRPPISSKTSSESPSPSGIVLRKPMTSSSTLDKPHAKIALTIPYSRNGENSLLNFDSTPPSVSVNSARDEVMKEFDPLLLSEENTETSRSGRFSGEIPHHHSSAPRSVSMVSVADDTFPKANVSRPITIINDKRPLQEIAFGASTSTSAQRQTSFGGISRPSGANYENLRVVYRKSEVERQLDEIWSNLFSEENAYLNNVWSHLIVSPRVRYPVPAVSSVKLIVMFSSELLTCASQQPNNSTYVFTCDISASIDQLTAQVYFEIPNNAKVSGDKVSLDEFALKVYALDEYFLPSTLLSDYAYVHNCVKLGKDIELELKKLPFFQKNVEFSNESVVIDTNDMCVKQETIEIALETIKRELQKLEDVAISGNAAHSKGVLQSIKMLCTLMHNIQPLDIVSSLDQLTVVSQTLIEQRNNRFHIHKLRGDSEDSFVFKPTPELLKNLKRAILTVADSVHRFVTTYANSSFASFTTPSSGDESSSEQKIVKEIVDNEECLLIRIESLHNFPASWLTTYQKFYLACYIFHGITEVSEMIKTEPAVSGKDFFDHLTFDSWINFNNSMLCVLPRESRVCFVLFGTKVEVEPDSGTSTPVPSSSANAANRVESIIEVQLCWGTLPLFDFENRLCQGSCFISMCFDSSIEPWGPKSLLANCNKILPVLSILVPSSHVTYKFPDAIPASERFSRSFDCLDVEQQQLLEDIVEHGSILDADEKDLLWEKRHYLIKKPEALPLVLKSAVSWDWACLSNIYQVLKLWTPLNIGQSVELLLPEFPDREVRAKAVSWLSSSGLDELYDFLPQLTEALSFEVYENSSLSELLVEYSLKNRRFAFEFYWQLEQRRTRNLYGCRCTMLQKCLLQLLGKEFEEAISLQQHLLIDLDLAATNIKQNKDSDRLKYLSLQMTQLDGRVLQRHVHLPLYPSVIAVGVDWTKCKYFNSLTLPIKVSFRTLNSYYDMLHKLGDDLRQDALVLQMIRLMDDLWLREGLDLRMVTYRCLSTGNKRGLIELVPDCKTLREIHVEEGGVTGALKGDLIRRWIQKQNASELDYLSALENFRRSCAGWCVGTFILGICDRHNDNIMMTSRGHVFHIDFGKYLGDAQMFGNFKRDRTPFILTGDMVTAINGGVTHATFFQDFIDYCCKAFNIIRNNHALFINLMKLMVCSNIPGLSMDAVKYICENLWLESSDNAATQRFTSMIGETVQSRFPALNFLIHTVANYPYRNKGRIDTPFSFTSRTYTKDTDDRLKSVDILDCEKWHENERKVYMYKIAVERINVKVVSYIYRSYKEFCELSEFLDLRFPLAKTASLPKGRTIGRTNVRDVAERRKLAIDLFLQSLFRMTEEIAHSDAVYTFFHPLLRDQQSVDRNKDKNIPVPTKTDEIRGELKISVEYIKDHLEVMVHHARDLPYVNANVPPDTYVKCYLRPDRERRSKRKTRIISRTVNPTYNESFVYRWPRDMLAPKYMELSVWRKGVLKENAFMGCVRLSLSDIFNVYPNQKITESWFKLSNKFS